MTASREGRSGGFRYLDTDEAKPVVVVSKDGRNRSRFEWVHVVRITSRPKRPLPTIVELGDADAPVYGRAMVDEVEMVHKGDLEDRRGSLSPSTMRAIEASTRLRPELTGTAGVRSFWASSVSGVAGSFGPCWLRCGVGAVRPGRGRDDPSRTASWVRRGVRSRGPHGPGARVVSGTTQVA